MKAIFNSSSDEKGAPFLMHPVMLSIEIRNLDLWPECPLL